ncbi:MAG: cupredoxin domain-containing protein [Thermomicrobiales bacterium]|nr:cupredoxin domain-containing protein [Thermomicrobiales bacterium]
MSIALRTVVTCAVAFGLMAVVGNAARETTASPVAGAPGAAVDGGAATLWQLEVTPGLGVHTEAPLSGNVAANAVIPVEIKGFLYIPEQVTVPIGASVAWTNQDNAPHTSTGTGDSASALSSGAIVFGQTFTQEFNTPGTYPYYCVYHPTMVGTVVVTP